MSSLANVSPADGVRMLAVHVYEISKILEQEKEKTALMRRDMQAQNEVIRYLQQRILDQEREVKVLKQNQSRSIACMGLPQVPKSLLAILQTSTDRIDHEEHKHQLDEILKNL